MLQFSDLGHLALATQRLKSRHMKVALNGDRNPKPVSTTKSERDGREWFWSKYRAFTKFTSFSLRCFNVSGDSAWGMPLALVLCCSMRGGTARTGGIHA
ncbi:MAG TPA: hypothetical protein DEF45_22680 [Rhodopirellula sp.]|nr:MAG: hypothetical protein CBD74_13940 [Saprospirales bacterium TMED214]HBV65819.1 hypothetical protein [Rhodopirellula sp.]